MNDVSERAVLIVDDERIVLASMVQSLSDWAEQRSVRLLAAGSAEEALQVLEREGSRVALAVSDLRMPGMGGREFFARVASLHPEIISVLITGFADLDEIVNALQSGVYAFILKPWDPEYLVRELDKALSVHALRTENRRYLAMIHEELRLAGELQRSVLGLTPPRSEKADFAVSYLPLPGLECGGDYCDVLPLETDRWLLLIGDVAGHGVKAALITFFMKAAIGEGYLGAARRDSVSPGELLEWLNRRLCEKLSASPGLLVTFGACLLDLTAGTLSYANAGHVPLHVVRDGTVTALRAPGIGLGFDEHGQFPTQSFQLRSADIVVLHTDGLQELSRGTKLTEEAFGQVLVNAAGEYDFHRAVLSEVRGHTQAGELSDDATLLSARLR